MGEREGEVKTTEGLELTADCVLSFYIPHLAVLFIARPGYRGSGAGGKPGEESGYESVEVETSPSARPYHLIWPLLLQMIATSPHVAS